MTADELRTFLTEQKVDFEERSVQYGTQFRCPAGEILTVFQTGSVTIQGTDTELSEVVRQLPGQTARERTPVRSALDTPVRPAGSSGPSATIFVVYGHDLPSRDALELLLRRMGLEPIILQHLPASGDTIIEKLEHYLGEAREAGQAIEVGFACVLLTPDDEGRLVGAEELRYRARQNVVLELGMVLAGLGRRRVAILHKRSVELPSDIAGLIYIPFQERVDEVQSQLYRELVAAGYSPRLP